MSCPVQSNIDFTAYLSEPTASEWASFRDHYPNCRECSQELAEWSDLEALLRLASAPAIPTHPSEEALLVFHKHPSELAPGERRSIIEHLAACAICRDALAAVTALDPARLGLKKPRGLASPGLLPRLKEILRPLLALPTAPVPALAILALLILIPVGVLVWSAVYRPAVGPAGPSPAPPLAALETAPEPVAPPPAEPQSPEAVAAPVEALEKPAVLAARDAVEPPRAPEPGPIAEEPAAPSEIAAAETSVRPEAKPVPAERPSEPRPSQVGETAGEEKPQGDSALVLAALAETSPPLYVPPSRGMPSVRVGGGTRGALAELPSLLAAAPGHVGLTVEESPALYWFLSEDAKVPVQFALSEPESVDPILEFTLSPPIKAGIHAVRLSDRGVVLQPDTRYRWFVSLVPDADRRSRDVIAGGMIDRIQPDEPLQAQIEQADPSQLGHVYATNGLWYDAFEFVSSWIERYPEEARLHIQRAALLEQVGLEEAAAWDRREAQTHP